MNARYWIALSLMLFPWTSWAMEHYSNVAQDQNGRAIVGATVTVYTADTTTPASIYSDNGLTVKSNPFTTGIDGIYDFYAADGKYDIQITKFGYTTIYWDPNKTKSLALFDSRQFIVPFGNTFPTTPPPDIGSWFVLTNDNAACTEGSGSNATPCRWDGTTWVPMGGGGGGGGAAGLDANFDLTGGNVITGSSETKKWTLLGTGGQAANGGVKYQKSDGTWIENCIFGGIEGNCDKYVNLNANKAWGIKNHLGNVVLYFDEVLGKYTTATIDCSQGSVACSLVDERHFAVATCQNTTASANFDLPTSNAPTATCNTGSNTQKGYLAFNDTTEQSFQDHFILPSGFSSMTVSFRWKAAATSGAVGWCVQFSRVPDGTTSDQAFSSQITANCISDTAKGTTLQENSATITGVTCSGCIAGDHVYVRISRDADGSAVTDDMTGDALLLNYGRSFSVTQ